MKRFILFKNGAVVGHFISERAAQSDSLRSASLLISSRMMFVFSI